MSIVSMIKNNKKLSSVTVYYLLSAVSALADSVMFTVLTIYFFQGVGLTPLQLVLVGTALEGTCLIFEVPTGALADAYSRRLSVIVGMLVLGAGFMLEGGISTFVAVMAAQVVTGIGYTFLSGAMEAWLAGEVGEEALAGVMIRGGQVRRVGGIAGTFISIVLASLGLNLPFLVGGALYVLLGVFLAFQMPETGFTPRQTAGSSMRDAVVEIGQTVRAGLAGIRKQPILWMLLAVEFIGGAASEGYDRLADAHLLQNFQFPALGLLQPVVWFGILNIAASFFSLGVTALAQKRVERASRGMRSSAVLLLALNLFSAACLMGFALAGNFPLAVAAILLRAGAGALYHPVFDAWLVRQVDPELRATMISMVGQSNALGQITGGPGLGVVGNRSLRLALVFSAAMLIPASVLFGAAAQRGKAAPQEALILPEQAE